MNLSKQNDNRSITSLLSQMNIGFLILDESGSIIKINNSCANFLDLSDNVVGCSIIELLGAHELVDLIRSKSVSGASPKEISGPKSSGRKFLVNTSLDAKSNELTIIMMDTTRVHKLESMRRDFITNISHELRTPLTVIRANAESLVDGVLKDQKAAKNFSEAILKNSEKMTTLLSDILNLATIESGEYSLDINSRFISKHHEKLKLTQKEVEIICYLKNSDQDRSPENLQKEIWKHSEGVETHTVETHIYRLRKKINDKFKDKTFIINNKKGYKLAN